MSHKFPWYTRVLIWAANGLALQALLSLGALVILIRFGYSIWPLMIIGTWLWAPCITLAIGGSFVLPVMKVLDTAGLPVLAPYVYCFETGLQYWWRMLAYGGTWGGSAIVLVWPGYLFATVWFIGGWGIYSTLTGRQVTTALARVLALWMWIALGVGILHWAHRDTDSVLQLADSTVPITVHVHADCVELFDPEGYLAGRRVTRKWLRQMVLEPLRAAGRTCVTHVITSRLTQGVRTKCDALAHAVGAPAPEYILLAPDDCKKIAPS